MRALEWLEQAVRNGGTGKRQFARQKLVDALEKMTDEQINTLCRDIMLLRAGGTDPSTGRANAPVGDSIGAP